MQGERLDQAQEDAEESVVSGERAPCVYEKAVGCDAARLNVWKITKEECCEDTVFL